MGGTEPELLSQSEFTVGTRLVLSELRGDGLRLEQ